MTDTTLNRFLAYGTAAARGAFTPSVPTPASGPSQVYVWYETDTGLTYVYASAAWHLVSPGGANPSATASDVAVNGTATTFMRSDGAPAIQKTSSSVFGLCKVDNTTITASGGVISASATGGSSLSLISTQSLSGTTTASFTSISGSYKTLMLLGEGRSTRTGTGSDPLLIQFNSDTGSNYLRQFGFANGSVASSLQNTSTGIVAGELPTVSDVANYGGSFEVKIPNYADTNRYKSALVHYSAFNNTTTASFFDITHVGAWQNTAAITRIDCVLLNNGTAGSFVSLYGIAG